MINKLHMYMSFSLFSLLFFKIYFKIKKRCNPVTPPPAAQKTFRLI